MTCVDVLQGVLYILLIPFLALFSIVLIAYGVRILVALRSSIAGFDSRSKVAFRNVTIVTLSAALGLITLAICVGSDALEESTIPVVSCFHFFSLFTPRNDVFFSSRCSQEMAKLWIKEIAGFWMLISLLVSLMIQSGEEGSTTKSKQKSQVATTMKEVEETSSPNLKLEKLRMELTATEADV